MEEEIEVADRIKKESRPAGRPVQRTRSTLPIDFGGCDVQRPVGVLHPRHSELNCSSGSGLGGSLNLNPTMLDKLTGQGDKVRACVRACGRLPKPSRGRYGIGKS